MPRSSSRWDRTGTPSWRYEKKRRWNERTTKNIAAGEGKAHIAAGTGAGITAHGYHLAELQYCVAPGTSPRRAGQAATPTGGGCIATSILGTYFVRLGER